MKLSFSTLGCPDCLEKVVEKAVEYGFDGIELRVDNREINVNLSAVERMDIKNVVQKRNLSICCLSGYSYFCSDQADELEFKAYTY